MLFYEHLVELNGILDTCDLASLAQSLQKLIFTIHNCRRKRSLDSSILNSSWLDLVVEIVQRRLYG